MCVILSIYQTDKKDTNLQETLLSLITQLQFKNSDGSGVIAFNSNNKKRFYHRALKIKRDPIKQTLSNFDIVNFHFRTATRGKICKENVHFWRKGNWLFAHNGAILGYGENKYADSLLFFNELLKKKLLKENGRIKYQAIKKLANKSNFWGRFIIINQKNRRIYYLGDFHTYLLNRKTLLISSQTINFTNYVEFYGMYFESKMGLNMMKGKIDGIRYFDISKKNFKIIDATDFDTLYEFNTD